MILSEDELERIAGAYHGATERYRAYKAELYGSLGEVPPESALKCPPSGWIHSVVGEVLQIIKEKESAS